MVRKRSLTAVDVQLSSQVNEQHIGAALFLPESIKTLVSERGAFSGAVRLLFDGRECSSAPRDGNYRSFRVARVLVGQEKSDRRFIYKDYILKCVKYYYVNSW
jgi:hypothetical protein